MWFGNIGVGTNQFLSMRFMSWVRVSDPKLVIPNPPQGILALGELPPSNCSHSPSPKDLR